MKIDTREYYDFEDVMIKPQLSNKNLNSRNDVDLLRIFPGDKPHANRLHEWAGVPIIASNMDTTGTFEIAKALFDYGCCTALHKHYSVEELVNFFKENESNEHLLFYTMGINEDSVKKFEDFIIQYRVPKNICIDVANGYSPRFIDFVSEIRGYSENSLIMAGNVVTGDATYALIEAGASIVKVGLGNGCLASDSRILMSNGEYKNITDVKKGDRIITMKGTPATVKMSFCTGHKKTIRVNTNSFYKDLIVTPDHKFYIGDLSNTKRSTVESGGYAKILSKKTKSKKSKLKWKSIDAGLTDRCTALMPKNIKWELPESFEYNISEYFITKTYENEYNTIIKSTYELGYMFGFFLGDGTSHININIRGNNATSKSGQIRFSLNKTETEYADKLIKAINLVTGKQAMAVDGYKTNVTNITLYSKQWAELLKSFGKCTNKRLPTKYYCLNKDYMKGLYDGLVDSDGHIEHRKNKNHNDRIGFSNTSTYLIELFGFLTYNLYGYFPQTNNGVLTHNYKIISKNKSYSSRHTINGHIKTRNVNDFNIIKVKKIEEYESMIPVYDLMIDDDSHSFIANNMIVHNSACTTRRITGVGMPQLSAVLDCANAAHSLDGLICSDGGCVNPGDVSKAIGAGADFVMLGGMLAGHEESGGETINEIQKIDGVLTTVPVYKEFYGMSSDTAMERYSGGVASYRASEGRTVRIPYKGQISNTIEEILGGLRSTMTYVGASKLKELSKCVQFIPHSRQLNTSLVQYENNRRN